MPALEHAVVFRLRSVTSPALRHEKLYCCRVKRGDVNTTLPPVRCQLSTLTGPQSWNGSARVHFKSGGSGPNGYQPKIITIDIFEKEKNAKLVGSAQVDITKVLKDGEQSGVLEGHALDFRGLAGGGVTFGATLTIDIAVYPSAQEQPPFTSAPPPADEDLEEDEATAEKVDMTEVNKALEDVEAELARYKNAIELRRQLTTAAEQAVTLATRRRVDAYTLATWSSGAYKQDPQAQPPNPATAVSKRQVLDAKLQETREAAKQTDDAIVAATDRVKIQQAKLGPLEKATEARTALLKKQHDLELAQAVREIADEFIALLGEIAEADAAVEKAQNDAGVTDLQHLKQRLAADERTLADLRFTARRHATSIADLEKQIGYLSADVTEFQQFNAKLLTALGSNLAQSAASHGVVALPEPDLQAASVGDTTTSTDMLSRTARSNRPLDDIFGGSSTSNASTIIATTAAAEMPPVRSQSPAGSLAQPQVIQQQQQQQPPQQQPLAAAQTMSAAPSMSSLGGNMPQATCTTPSVPSSAASARSGTTPGTSAAWTELNFSAPVAPQPSAATTVVVSDSGFLSSQSSRAGTTTSDVWAQQPLRAPQQQQQQQPDFSAQPQQQQQQQTSQPQQAAAQATEDVMQVSRSIDLSHTVTLCLQPGLPTKPAEASATSPNKSQLKAAEKEANEADLTERKAESKRLVKSQPQSAVDYDPFGADPSPPCSLAATVADLSTATATESDKKKDDPLSLMERAVAARDAAPAFDPFAAAVQETEAAKPTEPVFDAASLFEAAPSAAPAPPTADLFAQPMAQQQQQQPEVVLESFSATTGSLHRTATTLDETLFADAPSCKVGEPAAPSQVAPVQAPIKAVWGGNRVVDDVERDEELARAFNNIPHTPLVVRADNSTPQAAVDNTASRGASPAPLPAVRSASSAAVFDPFGGATMGSDPSSDAALFAPRSTSPQQQTMRTATPPARAVPGLLDAQGKKESEGPAHDADLFRDLAGAPMAQLKQMPAKPFTPPPPQMDQQHLFGQATQEQQPSPSSIRTSPSLQQHQDPFAMNTAATTNASAQPVKQVPSMHSVEDDFFGASPQRGASSSQCQSPPARVAAEHDDIFREFNGATSMSGTGHSQSPQQTATVPVVATTAGSINDIFGF